jgi:hypothetical protein
MFTGTDDSNGYEEVHSFAQALGYNKGWHYNRLGRHYYLCRKNAKAKHALRQYRAIIVSRKLMKRILNGTYVLTVKRDYSIYSAKSFAVKVLDQVCKAHGIDGTKTTVYKKYQVGKCWVFTKDEDFMSEFVISDEFPKGRVTIYTKTGSRDLEIPADIQKKIDALNKPVVK